MQMLEKKEVITMKKFYEKYRKKWWFWFITIVLVLTIVDNIALLFYNPQSDSNQYQSSVKYVVPNGTVIDYQSYHSDERGGYYGTDGTEVFEIVVRVNQRRTPEETVDQNYENAYELITNYDLTQYHTFKYKAIAINENGEEYTMMSFNIYAPWIKKISDEWTANGAIRVKAYATDEYMDEGLKRRLK